MDRYAAKFAELNKRGQKAFVPFTVLGYPDVEKCFETIKAMIDCEAAALELGLPFSDPVADGPIIQQASFKVLESGFSLQNAFELLKQVRAYNREIPIGLLTYYNTVLSQTTEGFFSQCQEAGVDSVLIADLPVDASDEIAPIAKSRNIANIFIVSPLTKAQRVKQIATVGSGYVYVVSRLGITGTEEKYDTQLETLLSQAREQTTLPLCVGFGVSSPVQARRMIDMGADGVITGSKIVELVTSDSTLSSLRTYLKSMQGAVAADSPLLSKIQNS